MARALLERWPVCADDDRDTEARTGKNPGRDKAEAAARAGRTGQGVAAVVLPAGLAAGGSDFNDLAAQARLAAVATRVEAAAAALVPQVAQPAAGENALPVAETGPGAAIRGADDAQNNTASQRPGIAEEAASASRCAAAGPHRQSDPGGAAPPLPGPFIVGGRGVWHAARDAEGNDRRPVWLCARLGPALHRQHEENIGDSAHLLLTGRG